MTKDFRIAHAVIQQQGLWRQGTSEDFRSALETAWVAGTHVTRYSRTWRLSRRRRENGVWAGHIGFVKEGELETLAWDDKEQDFKRGEASSGVVVPFIIDDVNGIVSYQLISGTVNQKTVSSNLQALLNNEGTYIWKIQPVSFSMEFDEWRESVARVSHINARLVYPNPNWTGRENLQRVMDGFNAEVMRIKAAAQEGESIDVQSDWFTQTLDHARRGYGKAEVSGPDTTTGEESKYSLTERGGVVPAISRVSTSDETAEEVSMEALREAQTDLFTRELIDQSALTPDEDDDDDQAS